MTKQKNRPARKPSTAKGDGGSSTGVADSTDRTSSPSPTKGQATRETVESIVVAVILAFLFRSFLLEAYVIPTGSMAPTLQGRHKDLECEKCGYWYRVSASEENEGDDGELRIGRVTETTCPICRYTTYIDPISPSAKHASFSGDRILVNKFCYDLGEPERWDVIVFKYPGNAVQNYIKRLVGLPNETLKILRGDIYVRDDKDGADRSFHIARKPEHKLLAMLQLVDDTDYIAPELRRTDFSRWRAEGDGGSWKFDQDRWRVRTDGDTPGDNWLRYRHVVPDEDDWKNLEKGQAVRPPFPERQGQLIDDFYAYNAGRVVNGRGGGRSNQHWVGDLAVEARVEVLGSTGELILELIEGGVRFQCRIDSSTGIATLTISGRDVKFTSGEGDDAGSATGQTPLKGGKHDVRFANVDDELWLWVDDERIRFDRPTTYSMPSDIRPVWSESDPGDLAPVGIGSNGLALRIDRLKVLRDIYYVGQKDDTGAEEHDQGDVLGLPMLWAETRKFDGHEFLFTLEDDQFFPMGDNSPKSRDARIWTGSAWDAADDHFVERDLLIGKAVMIYWPHPWNEPVPYFPNLSGIRFIR